MSEKVSRRVVVFEDTPESFEKLGAAVSRKWPDAVVQPYPGEKVLTDPTGAQLRDLVTEAVCQPDLTVLAVLDWDLSRYAQPVTRELVQGVCAHCGVPLAIYAQASGPEGELGLLREWQEAQVALPVDWDHESLGTRCGVLASGFSKVRQQVQETSVKAALMELLGIPEQEVPELDLYSWGQSGLLTAMRLDREERWTHVSTAVGYLIWNQLLAFPGLLLDATGTASLLDVDHDRFASDVALQKPFEVARYSGVFADAGPFWWTHMLHRLLSKATRDDDDDVITGRTLISRQLGIEVERARCCHGEGHDGAGFACIIQKKPVCEEHSRRPSGWLPAGATRARIELDRYDDLAAWLELE